MNPLDRLAVRLSLTRAEISVISILTAFLVLGSVVSNFRTVRDADAIVKQRELEQLSDKETDSLLAAASAGPQGTATAQETLEKPYEALYSRDAYKEQSTRKHKKREGRSENKVFSGTIPFNKATERQLQQIPGVGPVMAKRLVAFRASKGGRVERHEELLEVKGIGEKKLEILKKHLTLE